MFPIQSKVPTLTFVGDPVHLRGLNDCLELSSHSQYRSPYMQEQYLLRDRLGSMVAFNSSHRAEYGLLHICFTEEELSQQFTSLAPS